VAVGQNLVEFAESTAPELRGPVTDALLIAQLAADKAGARTPDEWFEAQREVLAHLGFRNEGLTRTAQDIGELNGELHQAILPVITAAFGGAALPAVVIATLEQLSEASEGRPWIALFERESRRFDARQFQVSLVEGQGSAQVVSMLGFALDIAQAGGQVLFFRHASDTVAIERIEGRFSAEAGVLTDIAPALAAKLADHRRGYLAALEI
jgi:hypothetical protein